jgi:tellurite resistance protein TehA-like permease|tara:strand:+ start:404 stop:613 length:210 start_codon:yes stop_codon:yes gene_type:complete
MTYFDTGVYIFLAIALSVLVVAIIVLYRNKNESSLHQNTEGKTPIFIPLLAIATSGLALVLIKYLFDTI